jgi:hypothetical protein
MLFNNALHRGQANACTLKLIGFMQTLKDSKQFVGIFHVETHAVIANKNCGLVILVRAADLNVGLRSGAGKLEGIGD